MDYSEYKRLKDSIESEYKKKLEALEMVWHMSQVQPSEAGNVDEKQKISVSDAIRKVIDGLSGEFSADDVQQGLKDHGFEIKERVQITNTLHRLMRIKEIEVARKGVGRTGSTYRKIAKTEITQ